MINQETEKKRKESANGDGPKLSLIRPAEDKKDTKLEVLESFNAHIPTIGSVKDDETGEQIPVSMYTPKTPDVTLKSTLDTPANKVNLLGEKNLSKQIFGVDSILELESAQDKAWKEVYKSAPEAMANLGKDEVEDIYDEYGGLAGEKVIRTANDADVDRIQQIQQGIKDQFDAIDKAEGAFLKQYEEYLNKSNANDVNLHHDSWSLVNPWDRRKSEKEMQFIKDNAAKYREIMAAKEALTLQSKFARTYSDMLEYDMSVQKGEEMSAMVSSGEITEDAMKILRASNSPEASRQYIERQVKNGKISRVTAEKLYKMGDLSEKNAFGYGFTHPGYAEDFLTFGMSEIKRNFDLKDINDRLKSGKDVSDDEKNALLMFSKMGEMLSAEKMDKRGWWFEAGMGLPKTLQFIAEIGITGGGAAVGKGVTRKVITESLKKYGLKKTGAMLAVHTGKRLGKNLGMSAILSPITPSSYVDYSNRVLNLSLEQENISWEDRVKELYKSYATTTAARFSETLDNVLFDMPAGTWLFGSKALRPVMVPAIRIAKKFDKLPWSKTTSDLLERFGIDGIHKEVLTEMADPVLQAAFTGDTEELKNMWADKEDFTKTVALHSAILGGFHGAMGYGVGAATAAIESQRVSKAYDDALTKIGKIKFVDKRLNELKDELAVAIKRNNYIAEDGKDKGRTVGEVLSEMDDRIKYYATTDENTAAYKADKGAFELMDYAARVGAYKFGESQNIKDQVARRIGVAKTITGGVIPMEFEHADGNVHEFTDIDGKQYFILDNSDEAVVLMDRATGEKVVKNAAFTEVGQKTITNANDWAMNEYLLNIDNWKAQEAQAQTQQDQRPTADTPPSHAMLRGVPVAITNFDSQTGEVTVTDQTGDELTMPINTPGLELVYPNQQAEQAPVQEVENAQPVAEENAPVEQPEVAPEGEMPMAEEEAPYVAPRTEENDVAWKEVPAENFKQVIDEEVGAENADGYIDMRIEDAQKKLDEHNEKPKPIASGEYKAFMDEAKKLESDLAYWTNAKQEYANAVAQEVAAQNEVEIPAQEEANEVAPESTVMYDAKQPEQVEIESPVQVSKDELDANVTGWKSNGINVNVVNSIDEVTNEQVLADMKKGVKVTGWYDTKTGEVYVFAPNITDTAELDNTVIHEVVAHKGLRGLVGEKYYKEFCNKVFDSMSPELQQEYLKYPGVNGDKAAAADEYIAYLAEKQDLTAEEQTFWDRIIQFFRELFDARLVGILKKDNITDEDIAKLIRMSYANIKNQAKQEKATEDTAKQELNEEGFETDNTGTVRFSVKYIPDESLREKIISNLMSVTGDSREKVEKWLESELSLANIINDEMNRDVLDYEADDRYGAIKTNSDYPQGTVDFNNICRKRLDFTNIYKQLQAAYPNRIFTAEDLETIRQTMIEDGLMVACGLCYVEDRRQLLGEIANSFIENLKNGTLKENIAKHLDPSDTYIPTIADLLAPEGSKEFYKEHPALYNAFIKFNNARGQQAGRLFEGYAEYKREILKWDDRKVKSVNNVGGLRIFSFSDFEAHHLIDIVQIVIDAASKGVMIQGYTKVPSFAKAMRKTGIKINRSLIPLGTGIEEVDGKKVLSFDPVEGIDVNDKDFLDEESNPNIGNILVGISDEHIRLAMLDEFIDYIIPFHSNIKGSILKKKNIGHWENYRNSQREKDLSTGKSAENGINIYTDVLQAAEAEGKPIKTKKQFVNKFLAVCKERGLEPRFSQFLDKDAKGNYVYTEGYHKLLLDFKLFDKKGKIIPQQPVVPVFDNAFNAEILNNYVEDTKTTKEYGETVEKIKERLGLEDNPTDPNDGPRYSVSRNNESRTNSTASGNFENVAKEINEKIKSSDIRYRSAQPFYSNAEMAVQGVKQEKATPEQWLAMLTKNGGLKASEDRWIGLSDWLKAQKGSVTKQDILDYINANKIEIEEANYSENPTGDERKVASIRLDYTTEGLENKKEIALVVPNIESYEEWDAVHFGDAGDGRAVAWVRFGDFTEYNELSEEIFDALGKVSELNEKDYVVGLSDTEIQERDELRDKIDHFNRLYNGKVLVIDEIQSKRHQDGREKGYKSEGYQKYYRENFPKYTEIGNKIAEMRDRQLTVEEYEEYRSLIKEHDELWDKINSESGKVPMAPFEKNWHELAMKRMLRYAAENGYSQIAWTTGATQAERYSLAKEVNSIEAEDNAIENFSDGTPIAKTIHLDMDYGESIRLNVDSEGKIRGGKFDGNTLNNVVGKDLAARLMEKGHHQLYGDGLTIGGEGMKGFYDKMLVDFMNKYGKKWGVKVYTEMSILGEEMHFVEVTDAMVRSVMEGQPMFRVKSDRQESIKTRQRAENIMKDAIDPMARELGIEVNYVTNESISDVEPGARKKRQSKGWYQDGKVYINLSTQETIDDARETYLHEVVGHYGLRGLLKDQFEPVMQKVFASLTPTQQKNLLEIFADEVEAAEEFLSSMAENDIDPTIVEKVIGFIREALRSMGINLDNYTDGDLQYLLWRSKNSLKENTGNIETARWEAKDAEVRYRTFKNGRLSADTKYGIIDKKIEQFKDSVWSVKLLQDEIVARGGVIDDMSDPYGQSTLMSQRSSYEIGLFNSTIYKPMLKAFSKAAKAIRKAQNISIFEANEKLENYLYAKHAIERNKKLAVDKMVRKASEQFADLTKEQRAQLETIATALYEDAYTGGVNNVTVTQNGTDFELSINWFPTKSEFTDVEFDTIKTAIDEWVADNKEVNESGLTDKEAQAIIDDVYVYQNADTQDMIDQLSDNVRNCTNFILDTWLKFGIISKSDYDKYKSQYEYYVPLRGWDETSDVDYEEVAGNAYNKAEKIVSLNNRAKGRKSKADSPLAFISQMATSAVIYGNKNLMKTMAFNMIKNNYDLIQDLVFIEDKDALTHKTKSEIKAHEVQLKVNGRTTRFSFKDNFEVGVAAASAIKGDNIQNFNKNNLLDQLLLNVGKVTRFQSRARTSWNPVFMIVNGVRDYFFGNLSFFIKHGLGDTIALNKNYAIGFAAAFMDAAGIPLGNSQWRQDYEAYKREGGQTGYVHMDDIERLKRETSKILRRYQNGWGFIPQDAMKLISYALRVMGEPAENAMRFATFKTLKDRGVSDRRAAQAAKEITVNFNRTGTQKWPGMLYGFFNATLEGTTNYFKMGFDKKTAARFWMANATLAALSYATAWWAKGFGDDDDDELTAGMTPEELAEYKQMKEFANEYNRISDYVKHTNILIPVTGDNGEEKKFIAIPLPQSYRIASALGTTLFDIINNDKNIGDELREFAWFTIGEIQPFDIENISFEGEGLIGNVRRAISPTPILPWTEVEQNRNFMGNPIMKESFINEDYEPRKEPSYTKAGSQTPEFLIATAKEINEKLGGTEYEAAKYNEKIAQNRLDAHGLDYTLAKVADALDPASVDHILKGYFGGFYELGAGAVERYTKDQTSAEDWVLAKRFLKNATQKPGMEKYFERKEFADEVSRLLKNEKKNAKRGENKQYLNSDPYNRELVKINEYWKKKIKKDTDAIAKLKKKGVVNKEKISELEDRRDKKILQAALAFERLERKYNK